VPEHSVTVLIGASGSQVHAAALHQPARARDDGLVLFDGEDICDPRVDHDDVRKRIGIVFQAFNLFPHMTVLDNITLALRKVHGVAKDAAELQARDLLDRFALGDKASHRPDQLSGGQQQRVAIVRALAVRPRLMLFDE
jgi:polar amino acid transport system ATP-binding protein